MEQELNLIKGNIPQFAIKLYLILEKPQFQDYISWNGQSQIVIKNNKKLQEKVLPHYFRHRKTSSFIRQLNMYKFNKVAKLTKDKNYTYFKNQNFKKGNIQSMAKIKRNSKSKNIQAQVNENLQENLCQFQSVEAKQIFEKYKEKIDQSFHQMSEILLQLIEKYPELSYKLPKTLEIFQKINQNQKQNQCKNQIQGSNQDIKIENNSSKINQTGRNSFGYITFNQGPSQVNNLFTLKNANTIKLDSLPIFPSYCSIENGF